MTPVSCFFKFRKEIRWYEKEGNCVTKKDKVGWQERNRERGERKREKWRTKEKSVSSGSSEV